MFGMSCIRDGVCTFGAAECATCIAGRCRIGAGYAQCVVEQRIGVEAAVDLEAVNPVVTSSNSTVSVPSGATEAMTKARLYATGWRLQGPRLSA